MDGTNDCAMEDLCGKSFIQVLANIVQCTRYNIVLLIVDYLLAIN